MVKIELSEVTNPYSNKEDFDSFQVFTFTDSQQTYRIDKLVEGLKPKLKCEFPCKTCSDTDSSNCLSCWNDGSSSYKYFFVDEITGKGQCLEQCKDGFSHNNSPDFVCERCDPTCATCKQTDKSYCVTCHQDYPCPAMEKGVGPIPGVCKTSCDRGFYKTLQALLPGNSSLVKCQCNEC